MLKVVEKETEEKPELEEVLREGARRLLMAALEAEVSDYVERFRGDRDDTGHALVVRNGRAKSRKIRTGVGTLEVEAPRVNDRRESAGGFVRRWCWSAMGPWACGRPCGACGRRPGSNGAGCM